MDSAGSWAFDAAAEVREHDRDHESGAHRAPRGQPFARDVLLRDHRECTSKCLFARRRRDSQLRSVRDSTRVPPRSVSSIGAAGVVDRRRRNCITARGTISCAEFTRLRAIADRAEPKGQTHRKVGTQSYRSVGSRPMTAGLPGSSPSRDLVRTVAAPSRGAAARAFPCSPEPPRRLASRMRRFWNGDGT